MAISREGIRVLSGPLWMALGAGFFACLVVGISAERTYSQAQVALLDAQQEQVRLVVQTSARLLDDRVRVDFDSDSLGVRSALALQSIRQLNQQIDAAYILTPVGKSLKVQNIAGKSPGIRKGVILDGGLPVARAVFEKGGSQVDLSAFERDGSSSLRSFAAVYRNGKIAGVLGIDYKSLKYVNRADSVGDTQRSGWLLAMLAGMLCSVAAYTVRFRQLREANNLISAKLELEDSNALLEDRVEQRTEELKHALSSKSLFLMSAGHELRTPLNGLMGMTTLALDTELSGEQREYFTHAKSSAIQLTQKINQLLDLASLETGTLRLELEETIVSETLSKALEPHRNSAAEKGLEFEVRIAQELDGKFLIARKRLHEIVNNLASNAVKFTDNGRIEFSADIRDRGQGVTWLEIEIIDTGCGVNKDRGSVFDLRNSHSLPSNKTGLGIALSISRRICQLMGGVLELGETDAQGTMVKVTVPLPRLNTDPLV